MTAWVEPVTLEGPTVRLEPLAMRHSGALWRCAEPALLNYTTVVPDEWSPQGFDRYVQRTVEMPGRLAFAIVLRETGEAIGTTSYMDIRPEHRGLEIGYTWIAKPHQGTQVNPENKYLLLRHAFEDLGAIRVQLKTDGRNLQSQRAIAKLGAQREGVLRRHMIMPDGYLRDTVMYSITDQEWPQVKKDLEQRLGYIP